MPRTIPARVSGPQHTQYLGPLVIQPPFPAAGVVVGKIPGGSIPVSASMATTTAFTGGTPAGTVGITGSAASIVAVLAPGAVGNQQYAIVAAFAPTADVEVRAFITGGATAGVARFAMIYVPPAV